MPSKTILVINNDPRKSTFAFKELMKIFINSSSSPLICIVGYVIGKGILLDSDVFLRKHIIWTHPTITRTTKLTHSCFHYLELDKRMVFDILTMSANHESTKVSSTTALTDLINTLVILREQVHEYYYCYSPVYDSICRLVKNDIVQYYKRLCKFFMEVRAWIWIKTKKGLEV